MTYEDIIQAIKQAPVTQLPAILAETILTCQDQAVFENRKALISYTVSILNRPLPTQRRTTELANKHHQIEQLKEILKQHGVVILEDISQPCNIIGSQSYCAELIPAPTGKPIEQLAQEIADKCSLFAYHSTTNDHIRAILIP